MPLGDIFSRDGGLFVVDLDDESLKLLTPSRKLRLKVLSSLFMMPTHTCPLLQRSKTKEEEEKQEEKQEDCNRKRR